MKKMFLLFSHTLTSEQKEDAQSSLGVEEFVMLPSDLQELWSNVPATLGDLSNYLEPLKNHFQNNLQKHDVVLVQGDFGATYVMVNELKSLGAKAVHATTTRNVVEEEIDGTIVKTSVFEHVRFRSY